jgi:RNA polymerase sigma-70 factor, ECF subfamily
MVVLDERESRWAKMMVGAQAGDGRLYNDLLSELSEILRKYFMRQVQNDALAQDLVQETLTSIHKGRHSYIPGRPFGPWLFSIARNKLIDNRRSAKRKPQYMAQVEDLSDTLVAPSDVAPPEQFIAAFNKLPEKQRSVLSLLKIEGFSVRSVAAQLGLSESDVKVTAHRAQKALLILLEGA